MAHDHSHHHHHHHGHLPAHADKINTAFVIGIVLNGLFVAAEVIEGIRIHSMSLLADAGHNLADVGVLALSLLAFKMLSFKPNKNYTYGYRKTSILVAMFNAMVLLVSVGAIVYGAIYRFLNPEPLPGLPISIVAGIGIIINAASALFFMRDKESDLNIKSAYLHLMSDAVVSLGLVVGGLMIYYTGYYWIDSMMSIVVVFVILVNTWQLLKQSVRLSLDGVPSNIDLDNVKKAAMEVKGVKGLHHVHVWAISTTENALTAHVVFAGNVGSAEEAEIKHELRHKLEHLNIHHITLETERESDKCEGEDCKA